MQRGLEQALDRAEEVIARARQRPPERRAPSGEEKSLHEKLYDIYVEECGREPEDPEELTTSSNLLEKLVSRESLPCLVFSLYPGDKGYSVMLDDKSGSFSETISLPYGESKLLEYLDAQQLPPVLLDLLSTSQMNLFHSGCVIAEIRDYRQCGGLDSPVYKSRHILLRPTMQTLVCDVEAIASDNPPWTQQDKLTLESQLALATAEPLCLDSSVAVACTADRLLFSTNAAPMIQCFKRRQRPNLSLLGELSHQAPPPDFQVLTFAKKIQEGKASQGYSVTITAQNYVDKWKQRLCDLNLPSEIDADKYATGKTGPLPGDVPRHCWPPLVLEYDCLFDLEKEIQAPEIDPSIVLLGNDPLWCDMVDPPKFLLQSEKHPTHIATGDHSGSLRARSKTDSGRAVSTCQESVQSTAAYAGKMASGPSVSGSVSQPLPGAKPKHPMTSVLKESSASTKEVSPEAPLFTLAASSGQCSSGQDLPVLQDSSSWTFPPLAPGAMPARLSQTCGVSLREISSLLPPAQPLDNASSQGTLMTQNPASSTSLEVVSVTGPAQQAPVLVSGSQPMLQSPTDSLAPGGILLHDLVSPEGLQPSTSLGGSQSPAERSVLLDISDLISLILPQLPDGSVISSPQSHSEELQPQLMLELELEPEPKPQLQPQPEPNSSSPNPNLNPIPSPITSLSSVSGFHNSLSTNLNPNWNPNRSPSCISFYSRPKSNENHNLNSNPSPSPNPNLSCINGFYSRPSPNPNPSLSCFSGFHNRPSPNLNPNLNPSCISIHNASAPHYFSSTTACPTGFCPRYTRFLPLCNNSCSPMGTCRGRGLHPVSVVTVAPQASQIPHCGHINSSISRGLPATSKS
ncbi:LOW QUALITY PROTEIN: transcription factor SPT20 homolog [Fukomys damarensis]|uniref:LOW QUALITY PROTEIN: transcription factor SPT20 homolog n=1 Tax=Fukomys damarensis TaxID=885580 RepID=UPI001455984C|nr:LOW QUALITY PROTEIN: transcription factor SPT20 homolog [Fukomys damarensis]